MGPEACGIWYGSCRTLVSFSRDTLGNKIRPKVTKGRFETLLSDAIMRRAPSRIDVGYLSP